MCIYQRLGTVIFHFTPISEHQRTKNKNRFARNLQNSTNMFLEAFGEQDVADIKEKCEKKRIHIMDRKKQHWEHTLQCYKKFKDMNRTGSIQYLSHLFKSVVNLKDTKVKNLKNMFVEDTVSNNNNAQQDCVEMSTSEDEVDFVDPDIVVHCRLANETSDVVMEHRQTRGI